MFLVLIAATLLIAERLNIYTKDQSFMQTVYMSNKIHHKPMQ